MRSGGWWMLLALLCGCGCGCGRDQPAAGPRSSVLAGSPQGWLGTRPAPPLAAAALRLGMTRSEVAAVAPALAVDGEVAAGRAGARWRVRFEQDRLARLELVLADVDRAQLKAAWGTGLPGPATEGAAEPARQAWWWVDWTTGWVVHDDGAGDGPVELRFERHLPDPAVVVWLDARLAQAVAALARTVTELRGQLATNEISGGALVIDDPAWAGPPGQRDGFTVLASPSPRSPDRLDHIELRLHGSARPLLASLLAALSNRCPAGDVVIEPGAEEHGQRWFAGGRRFCPDGPTLAVRWDDLGGLVVQVAR